MVSSALFNKNENDKDGTRSDKSIVTFLDDLGQSFKPRAQQAEARCDQAETRSKKIMYTLQSCCYYLLFILYRGYRGFFVLLPAVFRRVYAKLEKTMNSDLSLEDDTNTTATSDRPVSWRTKITVSLIATVVTISYVLGGALRVANLFFRTITKTNSVPKSFEAAANEFAEHEDRISRIIDKDGDVNGKDNGNDNDNESGLSP
jgi:hypothetical protein